jgi:PAS domain S-box-containing protein
MMAAKIILVEDERVVALHLKQQLTHLGYDVVAVAASGAQALERIVDLRPDLVLMDIHIEGELDGIDVSARIPDALGIPIIYLTAYSEQATLDRARATKPYGYLVKPFSEKELHATIQMALERHEIHDALETSRRDLEESNRQLRAKIEGAARSERELRAVNAQLRQASSERAIAERARAVAEAEFRAGFEGSVVGKAMIEPASGRILRVNRAFARMIGYEPDELVGRSTSEFTWPEDRASGMADYARLIAGEVDSFVDEKRSIRRDGTPFWVRVSAALARVPQGDHPIQAVVSIEDIDGARKIAEDRNRVFEALQESESELEAANVQLRAGIAESTRTAQELRKTNEQLTEALAERAAAERALARSEAEFRAGFEGSVVGKALLDFESRRVVRVNRALADMLGYEPEELIGRTGREFTWHEDLDSGVAEYKRLQAGEIEGYANERRYVRRDGTPFWVRVSAMLARVPQSDHPLLAVATVEDIDARLKAEAALLTAKTDLERLVEERTNALKQRDLLLREVYHRVKNNLQIVDSLLVMQARKTEDPQARIGLLGLRGSIFALGLVHHQLMGSADLQTFDVAPFLHELSKNILEGDDAGGVRLSVDACALNVNLDFAVPFGLLATELLTNAIRHRARGGGEIAVVLRTDPSGKLVLVVSDDGERSEEGVTNVKNGGRGGIVESLIAQLEGTMTVRIANGTRTEIQMVAPAAS